MDPCWVSAFDEGGEKGFLSNDADATRITH